MAIYHLNANVISRGRGQSIVAAAAYRSGTRLRDDRYGSTHDYTAKRGGAHAEIMAPAGAPDWVRDREALWNRVESAELRKDSQLARAIEVGLPVELSADQCLVLVRDYIARTFVSKGMVADFSIRRDNPENPLAHLLLTLREVGPIRIDHRTLEAQQIELTPARRVGLGRPRDGDANLPDHLADRITEQQRIVRENGAAILEDPSVVLRALAHRSPTFTHDDIARFLRPRTDGAAQFDAALLAVTQSDELVALQSGRAGENRFTSRDMLEAAKSLRQRAASMASRQGHGISSHAHAGVLSQFGFEDEQRRAFDYLLGEGDAKALALAANAGRVSLLTAAREAWERDGLRVYGVTRDGWQQGRDPPTRASVLVVDGAEMISLKPLERIVAVADKARAKIVLIGDLQQLQAMNLDSPFQDVLRGIGLPVV